MTPEVRAQYEALKAHPHILPGFTTRIEYMLRNDPTFDFAMHFHLVAIQCEMIRLIRESFDYTGVTNPLAVIEGMSSVVAEVIGNVTIGNAKVMSVPDINEAHTTAVRAFSDGLSNTYVALLNYKLGLGRPEILPLASGVAH